VKEKPATGFAYHLDDETLRRYRARPPELRLRWLYMGNVLRKAYPPETLKLHERLRGRSGQSI
jgi:hypothetical protein